MTHRAAVSRSMCSSNTAACPRHARRGCFEPAPSDSRARRWRRCRRSAAPRSIRRSLGGSGVLAICSRAGPGLPSANPTAVGAKNSRNESFQPMTSARAAKARSVSIIWARDSEIRIGRLAGDAQRGGHHQQSDARSHEEILRQLPSPNAQLPIIPKSQLPTLIDGMSARVRGTNGPRELSVGL